MAAAADLLDWRRRTVESYAQVRASPDPAQAWRAWHERRDALFREHPQSPLEDRTTAVPWAPYDPAWRFTAPLLAAAPERLDVETSDGPVPLERVGRVELPVGALDVWWVAVYGGGLFVPLADASNGRSTYGGGRYLLDTVKGADLGSVGDELVLDLNFAYHPSCRYSARWSCPLAPAGNRLDVAVEAGELL